MRLQLYLDRHVTCLCSDGCYSVTSYAPMKTKQTKKVAFTFETRTLQMIDVNRTDLRPSLISSKMMGQKANLNEKIPEITRKTYEIKSTLP